MITTQSSLLDLNSRLPDHISREVSQATIRPNMVVAGPELAWVECGGAGHINNMVRLPGPQAGGAESVGMFGDIVGTVNKCRVSNREGLCTVHT